MQEKNKLDLKEQLALSADAPLNNPEEDRLEYAPFAEQIAASIIEMSPAEGFVISINTDFRTCNKHTQS